MSEIENYKKLKAQVDFVYKGIHLNRVTALHIWSLANSHHSVLRLLRHAVRMYFSYRLPPMKTDKPIFSTYGRYQRKDHQQLYYSVISKLSDQIVSFNALQWGKKTAFHPLIIWKILKFLLVKKQLPLPVRINLAAEYAFYCNLIEELEKVDFSSVHRYLSMCSVLDVENLLTQYMRVKGIPSYSLMEGIYFIHKKNPPVDCVQYENFETDHLLSWGQYTKDEMMSYGIDESRVIVAGYPKEVTFFPMKKGNPFKKCMVMLARFSYHHSNLALLDILARYASEYHFCLKLHPNSDYQFYSEYAHTHHMDIIPKEKTVNECLTNKEYDFAIAVNTTAYYEALMRGIPCFRFCDDTFELMAGYDDVFGTVEEFLDKLATIKELSLAVYQKEINDILAYSIGTGIDKYTEILCE